MAGYDDLVDDLRSEYRDRKAEIMSSDCGVAEATYPDGANDKECAKIDSNRQDDVAVARESALAELVTELQGRQEDYRADPLDAEADTAAKRLDEGPTDETMIELFAAGALPSTTIDAFPDVDFYYDKLPSDLADMTDEQLARWLLDHPDSDPTLMSEIPEERPGVIDIMGEILADRIRDADISWDSEAADLQEYEDLLRTWSDASPEVTASLYAHLGAEDTLGFLDKLGTIANGDATDLAYAFRYGLDQADLWWDDDQRAEFGRDLGQAIEDNRSAYPPRGYESALSFLLDDNYYSTALLDPLGDKLAELDLGAKSWCNDGSMLPHDSDLMSSYFSCLQNNGEAALDFFGDDADRQEYYLKDRDYLSDTGGINNLLGALDAATTDEVNINDSDRQHLAAGLVSSIAEYLPENKQATTEYVTADGTVHLAHILGTYMESINDHMTNFESSGERGNDFSLNKDGVASPYFEEGELKNLVKLAVSSDDGIVAMREGVSAFQNLELARDMHDGDISEATLKDDARLKGFFMDAVGEQNIEDGEAKDKRVAAWVDMGKDLIGAIPLPGADSIGKLGADSLSFLARQATEAGGDLFTDAYANNEEIDWEKSTDASEYAYEQRQIAIASQLADPGTSDIDPIISHHALTDAASGYPDSQVEKWFGTDDSPECLARMSWQT